MLFKPFVGVGPHRYSDLFSINSIMWGKRVRKDSTGQAVKWKPETANLRTPMQVFNYIESEKLAYKLFAEEISSSIKEE